MDTKQPEALRLAHIFEHPLPPEWSDMVAATKELRRQHAENESVRAGYDAARLEIASLRERVQQLGQLARDVNSRRVTELETQLAAVGAGGVEPLRKRECLHQITEPAKAGWCDGCSPDNCGGCAASAAPAQAGEQNHLPLAITSAPERIWLDLGFNPCEEDAHFSNLHDLTWSQDNATGDGIEYVRADLAARGAAQSAPVDAAVQQDAERWQFFADYMVSTRTDLDDEIVGCDSVQKMARVLDAARAAQGAKHD